ncbi:DUF5518 domain-containing protein [Halalkalicoccus paucihalophilus]|uniref:DUF5518 domain-containing protein n=1 Tax=Halalkalicoccus paucihalophilus TaxID=1008153 RepID=UPI001FDEED10|nr:DUF5518 domain-containing protein [Halalkalicoccus paucihalophilus]
MPERAYQVFMTDWRSVGIGFVLQVVFGIIAFAFLGVGTAIAGFLAGLVSAYLTNHDARDGAWHSLLSGALGGIIIATIAGVAISLLGFALGSSELGALFGGSVVTIGIVIAFLTAIPSSVGGAIGGYIN